MTLSTGDEEQSDIATSEPTAKTTAVLTRPSACHPVQCWRQANITTKRDILSFVLVTHAGR